MSIEEGKKVTVTQIRSLSGRTKPVRATLQALGLGRIGRSRSHVVNPAIVGMLRKVRHLVRVVPAE